MSRDIIDGDADPPPALTPEESAVWQRARELDPTINAAAVQRFVAEIAEMQETLDVVDLDDVPLATEFTAQWSSEASS
jgi:hypothetical protein